MSGLGLCYYKIVYLPFVGGGSSTPSSTPRLHSSSPMAPGSSQDNSSVPHSREVTPIKGMEDSQQGRELFHSLNYSQQKPPHSNIVSVSGTKYVDHELIFPQMNTWNTVAISHCAQTIL